MTPHGPDRQGLVLIQLKLQSAEARANIFVVVVEKRYTSGGHIRSYIQM
ncbi:hypothetical protein [Microvirga aerophila]|nr:hypothetical protein [Microvirga aerophila]